MHWVIGEVFLLPLGIGEFGFHWVRSRAKAFAASGMFLVRNLRRKYEGAMRIRALAAGVHGRDCALELHSIMGTLEFEQMAAELERIAAQIRGRSEFNQAFAERIESLAKQMRQEVNLRVIRGKKT